MTIALCALGKSNAPSVHETMRPRSRAPCHNAIVSDAKPFYHLWPNALHCAQQANARYARRISDQPLPTVRMRRDNFISRDLISTYHRRHSSFAGPSCRHIAKRAPRSKARNAFLLAIRKANIDNRGSTSAQPQATVKRMTQRILDRSVFVEKNVTIDRRKLAPCVHII
jgi:cytochrome c551/c552